MMARLAAALDANRNEIRNVVIQNLTGPPSNPVEGLTYYDTTLKVERFWNGTVWVNKTGTENALTGITGASPIVITGSGSTRSISISDVTTSARGAMLAADKTKLNGIAAGATANATDAQLRDRSTHTGTQLASTISDFANAVSNFPLDQFVPENHVTMQGFKITNLAAGTSNGDAVNFGQLNAIVEGMRWKDPVAAATTAHITLSGPQSIDGVWLVVGDRVLVKNQTSAAANGIYVVASGTWSRAADANAASELSNATVLVTAGSTQRGDIYTQTATIATLGTTAQTWVKTLQGVTSYTADEVTLTLNGSEFKIKTVNLGQPYVTGTLPIARGGTGASTLPFGLLVGNGSNAISSVDESGGGGTKVLQTSSQGQYVFGALSASDVDGAVRKVTATIGNGTSTSFTVNHSLGGRDVQVYVYEVASPYRQVFADVEHTSLTSVTIRFGTPPTTNQYRVVVVG